MSKLPSYGYESNAAPADSDIRQPEGFWRSNDPWVSTSELSAAGGGHPTRLCAELAVLGELQRGSALRVGWVKPVDHISTDILFSFSEFILVVYPNRLEIAIGRGGEASKVCPASYNQTLESTPRFVDNAMWCVPVNQQLLRHIPQLCCNE